MLNLGLTISHSAVLHVVNAYGQTVLMAWGRSAEVEALAARRAEVAFAVAGPDGVVRTALD